MFVFVYIYIYSYVSGSILRSLSPPLTLCRAKPMFHTMAAPFPAEKMYQSLVFHGHQPIRSCDALALMQPRSISTPASGCAKFPLACTLVGSTLVLGGRRRSTDRKAKPSEMGEKIPQEQVKNLDVVWAEEVRIPTKGLGSYASSIYHRGIRIQTADGRRYIIDRMPHDDCGKKSANIRVLEDNTKWEATNRPIDVKSGVSVGDLLSQAAKGGQYNLFSNNCVQAKDRMRSELEGVSESTAAAKRIAERASLPLIGDALKGKNINPERMLAEGAAGVVQVAWFDSLMWGMIDRELNLRVWT